MSNHPLFQGSIVALVTPMDSHGEVDFENLKKLVEFHINAGTDAIVSVGTTGESATLSIDENVKAILKTVEFAAGRIPVIAGTGANATSEAITMTKLLNNSGISGCLSLITTNLRKKACINTSKPLLNVPIFRKSCITYQDVPEVICNRKQLVV